MMYLLKAPLNGLYPDVPVWHYVNQCTYYILAGLCHLKIHTCRIYTFQSGADVEVLS